VIRWFLISDIKPLTPLVAEVRVLRSIKLVHEPKVCRRFNAEIKDSAMGK